jgi:NAD(P)-dependent dehydrogenase (short-subunit alcohol dehydrogenase family)
VRPPRTVDTPPPVSANAANPRYLDNPRIGQIHILVNNAAFQMTHQTMDDWSSEEWDHTFRVNLYSMFYLCKAAMKHLKPGGVIINTASIQSLQPKSHLLAYATSKGAVLNFTKALEELAMQRRLSQELGRKTTFLRSDE